MGLNFRHLSSYGFRIENQGKPLPVLTGFRKGKLKGGRTVGGENKKEGNLKYSRVNDKLRSGSSYFMGRESAKKNGKINVSEKGGQ